MFDISGAANVPHPAREPPARARRAAVARPMPEAAPVAEVAQASAAVASSGGPNPIAVAIAVLIAAVAALVRVLWALWNLTERPQEARFPELLLPSVG